MGVKITVRDKEFINALRNATADGIARATIYCHGQAKRLVNKPNTGSRVKVKRKSKGGNTSSRTVYNNPSKAGEPPHKRTGFGQQNIILEIDRKKMVGRYGINKNAKYMFWLEVGTRFIAARPWMVRALTDNVTKVVAFLKSGSKRIGK